MVVRVEAFIGEDDWIVKLGRVRRVKSDVELFIGLVRDIVWLVIVFEIVQPD